MSDVAGYWARQLAKVPLGPEPISMSAPWQHRAMTGDDLGLPLPQWAPEFLMSLYGRRANSIRPCLYFWLGKDAEAFAQMAHDQPIFEASESANAFKSSGELQRWCSAREEDARQAGAKRVERLFDAAAYVATVRGWAQMPDGLTLKQRKFAAEYVKRGGNGTQAALAAGYAKGKPEHAAVQASENLRKPKIRQHINSIARRWDISAERVLGRLDNLSAKAEEEGQLGAAIKAEELIGKSLGMWVERSLNVTVDMTDAHLQALRDLAARGKGQAKVIEGQSSAADNLLDSVQQQMGEGLGLPARSLTTQRGRATAGVSGAAGEPASVPYNMHYGKRD